MPFRFLHITHCVTHQKCKAGQVARKWSQAPLVRVALKYEAGHDNNLTRYPGRTKMRMACQWTEIYCVNSVALAKAWELASLLPNA